MLKFCKSVFTGLTGDIHVFFRVFIFVFFYEERRLKADKACVLGEIHNFVKILNVYV